MKVQANQPPHNHHEEFPWSRFKTGCASPVPGAGRTRTPRGWDSALHSGARTSQSQDKGVTHTVGQWGNTE